MGGSTGQSLARNPKWPTRDPSDVGKPTDFAFEAQSAPRAQGLICRLAACSCIHDYAKTQRESGTPVADHHGPGTIIKQLLLFRGKSLRRATRLSYFYLLFLRILASSYSPQLWTIIPP